MQQYWKIADSKANSLIFIKDQTIYKGNPKSEQLKNLDAPSAKLDFLDSMFSIPYSYIRQIENQEGKGEIKIFYGKDSEEELIVNDKNTKKEIFQFLKQDMIDFRYSSKFPSVISYAKAQFFALLLITAIFIWTFYLAIQIESGVTYEYVGTRASISGLLLGLASFGTLKIVAGYVVLLGIIIFALTRRLKSRSEIEFLKRAS